MANLGNTVVNGKLTVSDEIDVNGTNVVETLNKKANTFSVSNTGNTLAWGTSTQIATVAGTAINVTMPSNPDTDLNTTYTLVQDSTDKHKIALKDNAGNVGTYVTIPDNNTTYSFSPANPTLSWGTKTSIGTAGGQTYYVTMPSNPNTDTHYTNYFAVSTLVGSTTTQVVKYVQNGDKTLTLVQGSNITLTPDATNSKITIAATNTVYSHPTYTATTAAAKKIGRDSTGHVVIGDSISASDVGAASSSHTHSLSLASGGTSSINLAANTTYTLTAGGSTYAFKTPADNNTTYSVATTSANGLMSSTDKTKLNGLDATTYIKKAEQDYYTVGSSTYHFNTRYIQGSGIHKTGNGGVGFALYNNYADGDTLTDDYLIAHIRKGATSPSTKSAYDNYSGIVIDNNQGIYISSGNTAGSINLGAQYGPINLNSSNTSITGSLTGSSDATFNGNLTANALKTTANNGYIDFLTGSGVNFGIQGSAGHVYNLDSSANALLLNNETSWTWGTLTTGNGYTQRGCYTEPTGGSFALAAKSGQTSVQIDGRFYDQEGQYRLVDTNDMDNYYWEQKCGVNLGAWTSTTTDKTLGYLRLSSEAYPYGVLLQLVTSRGSTAGGQYHVDFGSGMVGTTYDVYGWSEGNAAYIYYYNITTYLEAKPFTINSNGSQSNNYHYIYINGRNLSNAWLRVWAPRKLTRGITIYSYISNSYLYSI